jgi:hypothetical protein
MYQAVSMEKLVYLRRRLAVEADSAITALLTHLLEKETERTGIAIQKAIDRRDAEPSE